MLKTPHIVILGAGPAGLGAAYQLARKDIATVTVIEKDNRVGGIAGSFNISGINVDYGSHRLHPSCDPEILRDLQMILGDDLLVRQRHGRIRLNNHWIHFPLKPLDLALRLPLSFSANTVIDAVKKGFRIKRNFFEKETFAGVLEDGLGRTICKEFYFPYVQKIWGLPPEKLSPAQAHRRVSANSMGRMVRKVFSALPGYKQSSRGIYFYPKNGFGQITDTLYEAAKEARANYHLGAEILSIEMNGQAIESINLKESNGQILTCRPDNVWSTIPIPTLVQLMQPSAPKSVIDASQKIQYRAMILVYIILEQPQFSEYDAHYFPELNTPITRISEPKNYSTVKESQNLTVLCAELPCSTDSPEWTMTDIQLGELVCDSLDRTSIPLRAPLNGVISRRLSHAYPIYHKGYELDFNFIDGWISKIDNLLVFGRQGLFAHDNTHHALFMACAAVDCFNIEGRFNKIKWYDYYRKIFETHIVED